MVVAVPLHTIVTSAPDTAVLTDEERVFPSAIVSVALVAGAVIATLLKLAAVAAHQTVRVVPILAAFAAEIPPEVLIAPVIDEVASSVLGANIEALAPVHPIVSRVVAPARAVNDVLAVVMLVVKSGEVIDWIPVNVFAASVLAIVADVVGKVMVVPSVPANVREFDTLSFFVVATIEASYLKSQLAAVDPLANIQVKSAVVHDASVTIVFPPDEFIIRVPVLLFTT